MSGRLAGTLDLLMDIVYPRACLLCDARIRQEPFRGACSLCLGKLGWQAAALCPRCGDLMKGNSSCANCAQTSYAFDWAWSFGPFEGDLKRLIHAFKFQQDKGVGRDLALWITRCDTLRERLRDCIALLPVPMHSLKEKNRGFNQANVLAREMSDAFGIPLLDGVLVKCRPSVPQMELGRDTRWKNVSDTFAIGNARPIRGFDVVVVDDVMTTGATVHHCAQLLLKAGARRVGVAVVARSLL